MKRLKRRAGMDHIVPPSLDGRRKVENQSGLLQLIVADMDDNRLVLAADAGMNCGILLERSGDTHAAIQAVCPPPPIAALHPT